jgi:hypothetical protein
MQQRNASLLALRICEKTVLQIGEKFQLMLQSVRRWKYSLRDDAG